MPEDVTGLYRLIRVGGPDAAAFIQGQLTQDVRKLDDGACLAAAWCNPKGRVIVTLRVVRAGADIGLIVPAGMADAVVRRMTMYRLRSKVTFDVDDDAWQDYLDPAELAPEKLIAAGVPTIDETNSETFTPHMLNLDRLGALCFSKGCYPGQEVVARTQHRGASKRRLMRYTADADGVAVGDKVSDGDRNVGEIVNAAGRHLLAVTPVELHDRELTAGGIGIRPDGLPYSL